MKEAYRHLGCFSISLLAIPNLYMKSMFTHPIANKHLDQTARYLDHPIPKNTCDISKHKKKYHAGPKKRYSRKQNMTCCDGVSP